MWTSRQKFETERMILTLLASCFEADYSSWPLEPSLAQQNRRVGTKDWVMRCCWSECNYFRSCSSYPQSDLSTYEKSMRKHTIDNTHTYSYIWKYLWFRKLLFSITSHWVKHTHRAGNTSAACEKQRIYTFLLICRWASKTLSNISELGTLCGKGVSAEEW